MGLSQFDETRPYLELSTFTSGNTTAAHDIVSIQTQPLRIDSMLLSTDHPTNLQINFFLKFGGLQQYFTGYTLVAMTGVGGTPAIDVVPLLWPNQTFGLILPLGWELQVAMQATMTAGKTLYFNAFGGYL